MVEDIHPASMFQTVIFEKELQYGTYTLQWVFQICGEMDRNLLIGAWDRLQKKHQIPRTRLVRRGGDLCKLSYTLVWNGKKVRTSPGIKARVSASLLNLVDHSPAMQSSRKKTLLTLFGQLTILDLMDGQDV